MYRYHGPLNPLSATIRKAMAITAINKIFVIVFTSISRSPTFERGAELFITDRVSGPTKRSNLIPMQWRFAEDNSKAVNIHKTSSGETH